MEQIQLIQQLRRDHPQFSLLNKINSRLEGLIDTVTEISLYNHQIQLRSAHEHDAKASYTAYRLSVCLDSMGRLFVGVMERTIALCREINKVMQRIRDSWMPCLRYRLVSAQLRDVVKRLDGQLGTAELLRGRLGAMFGDDAIARSTASSSSSLRYSLESKDLKLDEDSGNGRSGLLFEAHVVDFGVDLREHTDRF